MIGKQQKFIEDNDVGGDNDDNINMFLGDDEDGDADADLNQEEEEEDQINIAEEAKHNEQVTIQYGHEPIKAEFGGGASLAQVRGSSQLAKNPRPEQQKPEGFGADFGGPVGSGVGAKGKSGGNGAPQPPTTGNKKAQIGIKPTAVNNSNTAGTPVGGKDGIGLSIMGSGFGGV